MVQAVEKAAANLAEIIFSRNFLSHLNIEHLLHPFSFPAEDKFGLDKARRSSCIRFLSVLSIHRDSFLPDNLLYLLSVEILG